MNPQNRETTATTDSNSSTTARNSVEIQFDTQVNFHGLHYCISIEPENADANCNGFWVVYCLPGDVITTGDLPNTFPGLDDQKFQPYVWGLGCFTASNQAPYTWEFAPRTSRTCKEGARILAYVVTTGISAGAVRINQILTGFTSL